MATYTCGLFGSPEFHARVDEMKRAVRVIVPHLDRKGRDALRSHVTSRVGEMIEIHCQQASGKQAE